MASKSKIKPIVIDVADYDYHKVMLTLGSIRDKSTNGLTRDLSTAFDAALACADFTREYHMRIPSSLAEQDEMYAFLKSAIFKFEGKVIANGSAVDLSDHFNKTRIYIQVIATGVNLVFYEAMPKQAEHLQIIAMTNVDNFLELGYLDKGLNSQYSFDLSLAAMVFGFGYDRISNEIILPEGMEANGMRRSARVAYDIQKAIDQISHISI